MTARRFRLGLVPEAFTAGLLMVAMDAPFDVLGAYHGWWSWSATDPNTAFRWYGVPVTSYYWHLAWGGILGGLTRAFGRWGGALRRPWRIAALALPISALTIVLGVVAFLPFHFLKARGVADGTIVAGLIVVSAAVGVLARRASPEALPRDARLFAIPLVYNAYFLVVALAGLAQGGRGVRWQDGDDRLRRRARARRPPRRASPRDGGMMLAPTLQRSLAALLVALPLACNPGASSKAPPPATVVVSASPPGPEAPAGAAPVASASAVAAVPTGTAFARQRPDQVDHGPDACAYTGGLGFACLNALLDEKDAVHRRYMRRMSDSDAREAFDALERGEANGVAHAEMALFCKDKGACGGKDSSGTVQDDGYACLTKAEAARQQKDLAASRTAHARACRCDPTRAQIPVMGGFLACDGRDKPVERGKNLTTAEAAEVRACAVCDAEKGPAACTREVQRLTASDPELAKYIETVHVPRCRKP